MKDSKRYKEMTAKNRLYAESKEPFLGLESLIGSKQSLNIELPKLDCIIKSIKQSNK